MGKHDHDDAVYEEVHLSEMEWYEEDLMYYYQCPCGDMFEISKVRRRGGFCVCSRLLESAGPPIIFGPIAQSALTPLRRSQEDLAAGIRIAKCPSCSLKIRVLTDDDVPGEAADESTQPLPQQTAQTT